MGSGNGITERLAAACARLKRVCEILPGNQRRDADIESHWAFDIRHLRELCGPEPAKRSWPILKSLLFNGF